MKIKFKCPEQTIPAIETIMTYENGMSIGYVKEKFDEWKGQQISGFMLMFDNQEEMDKLLNNPVNNWPPLCDSSSNPSTVTLYSGSIESTEPVKEVSKDDKDILVNVAFKKRIENALEFLSLWGQVEGDHHKAWAIDQVVRALCGCEWNFDDSFFQNEEYKDWVSGYCYDDNHVMEYEWGTGIAP